MIRYSKLILSLTFLFLVINFTSCYSDSSTNYDENGISFIAYQAGSCRGSSALEKPIIDSCFSYSFTNILKIDFCVSGNCCPDTNRFVITYELNSDTINVTVVDTAQHLCRCICNYKIHVEITGLSNNNYFFYCNYDEPEYKENLIRSYAKNLKNQ